jgi:hypothetical protein
MVVWLVEIFVCQYDDEYGYISCHYRNNKVFNNEKDAKKYLKNFRKDFNKQPNKYDMNACKYYDDESKITKIEL